MQSKARRLLPAIELCDKTRPILIAHGGKNIPTISISPHLCGTNRQVRVKISLWRLRHFSSESNRLPEIPDNDKDKISLPSESEWWW